MGLYETALAAVVIPLTIFLVKVWIKHEYDRALADVKHQHELAAEKLRADFALELREHEIRFARFDEKRAETIATVYGHLVNVERALATWIGVETVIKPFKAPGEHLEDFGKAFEVFQVYFYPRTIYLPKKIVKAIGSFVSEIVTMCADLGRERTSEAPQVTATQRWQDYHKRIPPLLRLLEEEFRRILNVREVRQDDESPSTE